MKNPTRFTLRSLRVLFFMAVPISLCAQVPDITVTGVVSDGQTGNQLAGVNIVAGDVGAVTNERGEFTLTLPPGSELEFSHIGFHSVIVTADNRFITVSLERRVLPGEEVIVTAGLTEESLQSVTSSLALLGQASVWGVDESHLQGAIEAIPNVHYAGGTSRPRYFQIRGIGERSHYAGEGPPNFSVGFVMDDVELSGLGMAGLLYDLKQVEVFRGPQSSIFGPNALAGLISLRSVDPSDEFSITGRMTLGSYGIQRRAAAVGGPVGSMFGYRLSFLSSYGEGFRKNVFRNIYDTNERRETLLRAKVQFVPSERISIVGTLFRAELDNGYDAWVPDNNTRLETYSNDSGEDSQFTEAAALRATIALSDRLSLTSITAFSETDLTHSYDGDWGNELFWSMEPYNFDPAVEGWSYEFFDKNNRHRNTFTQEVRLFSRNLVTGVYAKSMEETDNATGWLYGGDATEMTSDYGFSVTAGYAQIQLPIGERLRFRANIRMEKNDIRYTGTAGGYDENWEFVTLSPVNNRSEATLVGARGAVEYLLSPTSNLFVAVAQGYKAGGVNQHPYLADSNRLFSPEYILNGEVGYRGRTETATLSAVFFAAKRTDQQVSISSQQREGDPNSFFYYTANATSGSLMGGEVDAASRISETLSVSAAVGLLSTHVDAFTFEESEGSPVTLGDRAAAHAPNYSLTLGLDVGRPFGLFAHIDLIAKHEFYYSDSHDQMSGAYQLMNGHIGYRRGPWSVKMWGRNIFDERYATRGFYFGLEPPNYEDKLYVSWADPRHYGLTLEFRF